jgi:hypothetical protein
MSAPGIATAPAGALLVAPGKAAPDAIALAPLRDAARHLPASPPLDLDAIVARALAAPGGNWIAYVDKLQVPWVADTDDDSSGRYIGVLEGPWHTGSEDPPPGFWAFLASARPDVLALVGEILRLRAKLAAAGREAAA